MTTSTTRFWRLDQRPPQARRELALRHLGNKDLKVIEIAFQLGFSEVSAFYRAFRRWTGTTPVAYRRDSIGV